MNKIIITERQFRKVIKEAAIEGFNPYELDKMSSFSEREEYCNRYLGNPIGEGSSRIVYQISDEKVLKLDNCEDMDDYGNDSAGASQNILEYDICKSKKDSCLFPVVYSISPNSTWIIEDYVIPITDSQDGETLDGRKLFRIASNGVTWDSFLSFITDMTNCYTDREFQEDQFTSEEFSYMRHSIAEKRKRFPFLNKVAHYMAYFEVTSGDLGKMSHWGLIRRRGRIDLVLLDFGLNKSIYDEYY